jgi:hypothetical protein
VQLESCQPLRLAILRSRCRRFEMFIVAEVIKAVQNCVIISTLCGTYVQRLFNGAAYGAFQIMRSPFPLFMPSAHKRCTTRVEHR